MNSSGKLCKWLTDHIVTWSWPSLSQCWFPSTKLHPELTRANLVIFLKYPCHFSPVQAVKSSVVAQIMCFKPEMGAAVMQHLLHCLCATWATPKEVLSHHNLHHSRQGCFSLQPWALTHHYLLWMEWKCWRSPVSGSDFWQHFKFRRLTPKPPWLKSS